MKKILSFILALVMLLALAVPCLAADTPPAEENVDPCSTCDHNFEIYARGVQNRGAIYVDNTGCRKYILFSYGCTKCGYCYTSYEHAAQPTAHSGSAYSASCNGTTQTVVHNCNHCKEDYTKLVRCPMATHTGPCQWLVC